MEISGSGLGFRRGMENDLTTIVESNVNFVEVAPENWMRLGGKFQHTLAEVSRKIPLTTHGLSLSIGSPDPLDIEFVREVKTFMNKFNVRHYTEHLSYCSANGHMYDLMPIPFTEEAVRYVAARIRLVQDVLEQQIAIENVSYYLKTGQELSESEFLNAVLAEADCKLLFDVNNVYVNSINHKYNAKSFIDKVPSERILYGHIAGHYDEAVDLKVDTHGDDVKPDVWALLEYAYAKHGVFPTLLERDFNIPPMSELLVEVDMITAIQNKFKRTL
ncbi:DUF692 domain-containing protein [Psychrosphaera sp. I2R16]|uniref:HvfB family MNIO-type RiPP peptide maturase n=1 Tax=unclassified Psychrosphaera TaxID=2641570 RepID=UPI0034CDBFD7